MLPQMQALLDFLHYFCISHVNNITYAVCVFWLINFYLNELILEGSIESLS